MRSDVDSLDEMTVPTTGLLAAPYQNMYMTTQGEEQSTRSSVLLDPESASSYGVRKRSLANELKVRRQRRDLTS
jgi:hypothetical protein